MDRCPNCDAPVRPNAKFCTSCGFRLPNAESVKPVAPAEPAAKPEGWRSPFATTSNYEHNQSWTAPVPSPSAPPPPPIAIPTPPIEPVAAPAPAEPVTDDAAPVSAGWPDFSTSTIPAEDPTQPTHDVEIETAPVVESGPVVVEADLAPIEATPDVAEIETAADEIIEPIAPETSDDPIPVQAATEAAAEPAPSLPEVGENPADNPTEPIPMMTAIAKSDIVQRALGLVDELRHLIPNLKAAAGPSDTDGAAAILKEASASAADSDALAQLRTALETAASRPRDIDVMMDLISRAGAIQDLLAERDRYNTAISAALAALETPAE